jgi:hypothetical protein
VVKKRIIPEKRRIKRFDDLKKMNFFSPCKEPVGCNCFLHPDPVPKANDKAAFDLNIIGKLLLLTFFQVFQHPVKYFSKVSVHGLMVKN